jgi:hypothetical protein
VVDHYLVLPNQVSKTQMPLSKNESFNFDYSSKLLCCIT